MGGFLFVCFGDFVLCCFALIVTSHSSGKVCADLFSYQLLDNVAAF